MKIVAATRNEHKLFELQELVKDFQMEILSQEAAGLADIEVTEDGDTFEANSYKKASEIMKRCGLPAIADDSGLMSEALSGAPGVYSARFSGENATDAANNEKLLSLMKDHDNKKAKFVSVVTLVYPDGRTIAARGECEGYIIDAPRGNGGFGYDPLFIPDGCNKTFAELTGAEKNKISHRAKALTELKRLLSEV